MGRIKAEYIWMDGHKPTSKLRSKTKIIDENYFKGYSLFKGFIKRYLRYNR